jgi:DNA polymerase III epsilon subunit-like protein
VDKENKIGENTFLKLRKEKEKIKEELEQVKLQRDIALRKQKKLEEAVKDLRKLVEHDNQTT